MSNNPQVILKNRYQVVPRTLILIFNNKKVLLQRGSLDKKIFPGLYNGLGGHIERGEDVLSAARRELIEEAGISCDDLHICGTITIDVTEKQGILLFVMTGTRPIGGVRFSDEGSIHWVAMDEIPKNDLVDDVWELITKIKSLKDKNDLFHAHYTYDGLGNRITIFGK